MSSLSFPLLFWGVFVILSLILLFCDRKYYMLRDISVAIPPPYSWSRVQLAWWTVIVLSAFTAIFLKTKDVPALDMSTVILLGISSATMAAARVIDVADQGNPLITRHQDSGGDNFFLDILSDQSGPGIHRFQTIVFNFVFGLWFITTVLHNFQACATCVNTIIPVISDNNLILLGLSSATYAAVKTQENKSTPPPDTPAPPPAATPTGTQG